jgi:tetratricopeptide (TPR) repeat protein
MLARGDSLVALNNLAGEYRKRRESAKAESLYRAAIAVQPSNQSAWSNLIFALWDQGRVSRVDSEIVLARNRFPNSSTFTQRGSQLLLGTGQFDAAARALDSARRAGDARFPSWAVSTLAGLESDRGRLREAHELAMRAASIDSAAGQPIPTVFFAATELEVALAARASFTAQLAAFDTAVAKMNIDSWPVTDRPYLYIATLYARAGRADVARSWLSRFDAAVRDTALRRVQTFQLQRAQSRIALEERRWKDAADLLRKSDRVADGPVDECATCVPLALIDVFATANWPDSALTAYAEYQRTPEGGRARKGPDRDLGAARTEALAKIFDAKGDTVHAVQHYREFVELWKNADPELQPRVVAARQRLQQLTPVEK